MQQFIKITTSLILILKLMACHISFANTNSKMKLSVKKNIMNESNNILLKKVTLITKEERLPPLGIAENTNRDIGFASVFIRLKNYQETTVKLIIQNIEICNVSDGKLQPFTFSPQQIDLNPLENSEIAFNLNNKIGYIGQDKVKAFVTYQINNQTKVIESEAVAVNKM